MNDLSNLLSVLLLQMLILSSLGDVIDIGRDTLYSFERTPATWDEAVENCQRKGPNWRLGTIDSLADGLSLSTYLSNETGDFWIGVRRSPSGMFERIGTVQIDFFLWGSGEPGEVLGLDCVEVFSKDMEWRNARCNDKQSYLCATKKVSTTTEEPLSTTLLDTMKLSMSTNSPSTTAVVPTIPTTKSLDNVTGIDVGTDTLYYIGNSLVTWDEAAFNCHKKGQNWRLASFDSSDDLYGLNPYVRAAGVNLWIGIRRNSYGTFIKIGSEKNDYFYWAPGEPNVVLGENCVELFPRSMRWNNLSCSNKRKYICAYRKSNPSTTAEVMSSSPNPKSSDIKAGDEIEIDIGTGKVYSIEESFATWDEAALNCQRKGTNWHLATLDSREEVVGLYRYVKHSRADFWIGLRRNPSGMFERVGNQTSDYFKWAEGEPNNASGTDCVQLDTIPMEWSARKCDYEKLYMCASSRVKPSTSSSLSTAMMLKSHSIKATPSLYIEAGNVSDCSATLIILCVLIVFAFFGILAVFVVKRWPPIPQTSAY